MNTTRILGVTAGFLALAGGVSAQQADDIIVFDATNDRIYRSQDLDLDGVQDDINECTLLVDAALIGAGVIHADGRTDADGAAVYWSSGFGGDLNGIYRGVDSNQDGHIQLSEMTAWWDAEGEGVDLDADGVALTADGAVWCTSDFDTDEGIWKLIDANGSGSVNDDLANERFYMVDGTSTHLVGFDGGGSQAISTDDFQLCSAQGNAIIAFEGFLSSATSTDSECSIFRFEDMNGDGDVTDGLGDGIDTNDESRLFLNYSGKIAGLPKNPDFGTLLRKTEIDNGGVIYHTRFWHNATRSNGGTDYYYIASEASNTGGYSTNVDGFGVNGLIYQGIDLNGDNDINDTTEVTLFYDGSHTSGLPQISKILGMEAVGDWVYVHDLAGHSIHRFRDLNGDKDAMDLNPLGNGQNEFEFNVFSGSLYDPLGLGTGIVPFVDDMGLDLPLGFVTGSGAMDVSIFDRASNYFEVEGVSCATYGAFDPKILGSGNANIGTANWTAQLRSSGGAGILAILTFGNSDVNYSGAPILPLDLTQFGYPGCFLYQNLIGQKPAVATNGAGNANVAVAIPNKASLIGKVFHFQFLLLSAAPQGVGLTAKGSLTIEQ